MAVNVSAWVWTLKLPVYEKMVMLELADHADTEGYCFPKQKTIAERTSIRRETVNRVVKRLETMGYLTISQRFFDGKQRSNEYRLSVGMTIYLSDAGSHGGVTQDHTPECVQVTPIETSLETSEETSNGGEPQEVSLKIQEVIDGKSKSKDEILTKFTPTPKGCGDLWRDCRAASGEHGFQAELLSKDWSMLNKARIRVAAGGDYPEIVWKVMHNWDSFCKHAENHAGAFNSPLVPQVAFFVKFIEAAVDYAEPVKSIAQPKPLTNKPAPSTHIPKAKEPPITLSELLAMNEDDE